MRVLGLVLATNRSDQSLVVLRDSDVCPLETIGEKFWALNAAPHSLELDLNPPSESPFGSYSNRFTPSVKLSAVPNRGTMAYTTVRM